MRALNLRAWADRAARKLRAADPGREPEVVLDPPRRAGLAAERGALDHERVEPLRGAVDRGSEPGRAAADDEQVDVLAPRELATDPERPQHLAVGGPAQLRTAGQPYQREAAGVQVGDKRRGLGIVWRVRSRAT